MRGDYYILLLLEYIIAIRYGIIAKQREGVRYSIHTAYGLTLTLHNGGGKGGV